MTYEEKVMVLAKYKSAVKLADYYKTEIEQYRAAKEQAGIQKIDDMPHAHGSRTDLSDYMVKLETMYQKMYEQLIKAEDMKLNIAVWCNTLSDVEERLIVQYHYLHDHNLGWIADEILHCSYRTAKRRHNSAIKNLPDLDSDIPWLK